MPPKKNEYIRTIPNDYTKYSPLGRDEIRLLRIRKLPQPHCTSPATPNTITITDDDDDDDHTTLPLVHCELYRVKLLASQRRPLFTTLSYCWGDLRHTLPITVIFRDAELLQFQSTTDHDDDEDSPGSGWNLPPTTTSSSSSPVSEEVGVENFNVTVNLHTALHAFRADLSFEADQFLWTDMLCINQDGLAERSYQVSLMRDIYDGSSLVEVWLGSEQQEAKTGGGGGGDGGLVESTMLLPEDDLLTDELMVLVDDAEKVVKEAEEWREGNWEGVMMRLTPGRFVDRLERDQVTRFAWVVLMRSGVVPPGERDDDRQRREELFEIFAGNRSEFFDTIIYLFRYALGVNDSGADDEDTRLWVRGNKFYQRVMRLSQLDWFRRTWVIQEVVYSKQTFVRHANTRIRWNSMLNLVRIMGTLKTAQWSKKMLRDMNHDGDDELHVPRLWKEGLKPSAQLDWNPTPGYAMLPSLSPLEVIFQTSAFIATDPRDRLFGILSLIPPASSGPTPYWPDYKKSIAQASCDFTKWHVEALGSWDVLSLCRPRGQRSFFRDSTLPSWAIDFKNDYGEIPPFALQKHVDGSPMFAAGICPRSSSLSPRRAYRVIKSATSHTQEGKDSNKITLPGCIVAHVTKVWSLNSSSISWFPRPELWIKDKSPAPPPPQPEPKKPVASSPQEEASAAANPFLNILRLFMAPVALSLSLDEDNKFQGHEVDPIRWKSAMASHTARILRELWETLFYPCSGLEAYHHQRRLQNRSLDDTDISSRLTIPLSNLHTLLTGIALCSRLSVAEVALLFDSVYYAKEEDKLFPFFVQAEIKRLATTKGATTTQTEKQTGTQRTETRQPDLESSFDPFVLQALSWGVFATDDGRVGVGHAYARKGDEVLIAEGARTGYIVRPPSLAISNIVGQEGFQEKEWQVVGECLLAGRMYGKEEALVGDPLYDDVLEADVVGRCRYREEGFSFAGSGVASKDVGRGRWKYRSSFWMGPVTLV